MIKAAGNTQIKRVKSAKGMPPLFMAMSITVCVEEGPGNIWQKALYSSNSSSEMSFLLCTKVRAIIPI